MDKVKIFFEDWTYNSVIKFLEMGKDDSDIKKISQNVKVNLPSPDLAPFKCVYAFVDQFNKNKCRLPREEVEKALNSIVGKAIDVDHFRKKTVGFWAAAEVVENKIISYGLFWRSNFKEEYGAFKKKMEEGEIKISFEAYGNRVYHDDGSYDLTDIEFAGGALLVKEEPAFPGTKVLEFAKVYNNDDEFKKDLHLGQTFICECINCGYTMETTNHCKDEKCPQCGGQMRRKDRPGPGQPANDGGSVMKIEDILELLTSDDEEVILSKIEDFDGTDDELELALMKEIEGEVEESKKLTYQERKNLPDDKFAIVIKVKKKKGDGYRKIRMFPIHDESHIRNALSRLNQEKVRKNLRKLGVSIESVRKKILKRAKELNMTQLLERYKGGVEMEEKIKELEAQVQAKDEEIAKLRQTIDELKKESEEAKAKVEQIEQEVEKKIEEAKEQAKIVAQRRAELGEEFAKDLSDEDLLDDVKFENAQLKKQLAELKKKEKASYEKGSKDNQDDEDKKDEDNLLKMQKRIRKLAFKVE